MPDLAHPDALWWALALGADFGGNLTAIGASANVVMLGIARRADNSHLVLGVHPQGSSGHRDVYRVVCDLSLAPVLRVRLERNSNVAALRAMLLGRSTSQTGIPANSGDAIRTGVVTRAENHNGVNAFREGTEQLIVDVTLSAQEAGPAAADPPLGHRDERPAGG